MTMAQLPSVMDHSVYRVATAAPRPQTSSPVVLKKPVVLPSLRATHELSQHLPPTHHLHQPYQQQQQTYAPMGIAATRRGVFQPESEPEEVTSHVVTGALRRGKWTRAEEDYAAALISFFCDGLLSIQYGTTLRGYLAQQLHCDPMRISKKLLPGSVFAGIKINPKIGRRAYYPCSQDSAAALAARDNAKRQLRALRTAFIRSVEEEEALESGSNQHKQQQAPQQTPQYASPSSVSSARVTTTPSPPPRMAVLGRKRSYDDIMHAALQTAELTTPQITYHERLSPPKFPKLAGPAAFALNAGRRRSFAATPSPPMASVLPPLRVSLVRASLTS